MIQKHEVERHAKRTINELPLSDGEKRALIDSSDFPWFVEQAYLGTNAAITKCQAWDLDIVKKVNKGTYLAFVDKLVGVYVTKKLKQWDTQSYQESQTLKKKSRQKRLKRVIDGGFTPIAEH